MSITECAIARQNGPTFVAPCVWQRLATGLLHACRREHDGREHECYCGLTWTSPELAREAA